ncbi:ABC transporter ATP-binding protein [Blautia pseudococcoides]|nr:ABC transporter ATP-binding protein [Blautia pseudococcoides]QJU14019.1 ABC transporter ATP-binding protein [Blautia pseudococcoides]
METLLEIRGLSVTFQDKEGTRAARQVNLRLDKGEMAALVGESGSGKTVLCKTILQLLGKKTRVENGEILYRGSNLLEYTEKQMQKFRGKEISMVFQDPYLSLNPTISIGKQIMETILLHEKLSKKEAKDRTLELLELTGFDYCEKRFSQYPHQFSGGMRQRAAIAIALACRPGLLLADEPTTALDVETQQQIMELLAKIRKETGVAILFITHDLGLVENVADRVYVMYQGEIVESGSVSHIFQHAQNPYTVKLLGYRNYGKGIGHTHGKIHFHNGTPHTHGGTHDHMHPRLEGDISHPVTKVEETSVRDDQVVLVQEPEPEKLMEIQHLSKNFRLDRHTVSRVLDDFSLDIYRGEIVGVAGPSGCGKSTLARCIVGLYEPDGGQILYHGDTARIYRRQMIFQDSSSAFNPHMTLEEIIGEPLRIQKLCKGRQELRSRVYSLMEQVELDPALVILTMCQEDSGRGQPLPGHYLWNRSLLWQMSLFHPWIFPFRHRSCICSKSCRRNII